MQLFQFFTANQTEVRNYVEITEGFFIDGRKGDDNNDGGFKYSVKTISRLNELLQNVPEFVDGEIQITGKKMLNTIDSEAKNSTFELKD